MCGSRASFLSGLATALDPVDEELVRQVRIEMLKETTRGKVGKVARWVTFPAVCRRPPGFPKL